MFFLAAYFVAAVEWSQILLPQLQSIDEGSGEETAEGTEKAVFKQLCWLFCREKKKKKIILRALFSARTLALCKCCQHKP